MNVSKNFVIQEYVPPELYEYIGDDLNKFYRYIDPRLVELGQEIRDHFNKSMTINNWSRNGKFQYRGWRPFDYYKSPTRNKLKVSQHQMGRAIDFTIKGIDSDIIRAELLLLFEKGKFQNIGALEDDVSWVHADIRYRPFDGILVFKP
jgi:hypothetical protein|tara:strand:+ start:1129 stop:1572 length:444 start_codon:yes stop_codon:yes gene_type:complete